MPHDEIRLTFPRERGLEEVAHLVLGGLAARRNLTLEHLDDLTLAVDGLIATGRRGDDVTVVLRASDDVIEAEVGPFASDSIRAELERDPGDDVGLRRVLDTVADGVSVTERDGGHWVELEKRI